MQKVGVTEACGAPWNHPQGPRSALLYSKGTTSMVQSTWSLRTIKAMKFSLCWSCWRPSSQFLLFVHEGDHHDHHWSQQRQQTVINEVVEGEPLWTWVDLSLRGPEPWHVCGPLWARSCDITLWSSDVTMWPLEQQESSTAVSVTSALFTLDSSLNPLKS